MGNIIDYLDQYYDVDFDVEPFNEVDNLVIAQLAYLSFDKIIPSGYENISISVSEAADRFFRINSKSAIYETDDLVSSLTPFILQKMGSGKRFSQARLGHYVCSYDTELPKQFAALSLKLDDCSTYVAYRGTDNTLIGWREDFEMSFTIVAAQQEALAYLETVAAKTTGLLRVGGHSKGGNLAVFASTLCSAQVQGRIMEVFNNDGPGFCRGTFPRDAYSRIKKRIHTFVPEYCIVGMLFERPSRMRVVGSDAKGILQHSATSWEVSGTRFLYREKLCAECQSFNHLFNDWIESVDPYQRKAVVADFFNALDQCGFESFSGLVALTPFQAIGVIRSLDDIDSESKIIVEDLLLSLVGETVTKAASPVLGKIATVFDLERADLNQENIDVDISIDNMKAYQKRKRKRSRRQMFSRFGTAIISKTFLRGALLSLIGILLLANAEVAAPIICYVGLIVMLGLGITFLYRFFRERTQSKKTEPALFLTGIILIMTSIVLVVFKVVLVLSFNVIIGFAFLLYSFYCLRKGIQDTFKGNGRGGLPLAMSITCLLVGVAFLINPMHLVFINQVIAGIFVMGKGLYDIAGLMYERVAA